MEFRNDLQSTEFTDPFAFPFAYSDIHFRKRIKIQDHLTSYSFGLSAAEASLTKRQKTLLLTTFLSSDSSQRRSFSHLPESFGALRAQRKKQRSSGGILLRLFPHSHPVTHLRGFPSQPGNLIRASHGGQRAETPGECGTPLCRPAECQGCTNSVCEGVAAGSARVIGCQQFFAGLCSSLRDGATPSHSLSDYTGLKRGLARRREGRLDFSVLL